MENLTAKEGKNIAIIAYITFIGGIIALFMNKDKKNEFAAFHLRQAIGLHLLYLLLVFLVSGFDSWLITSAFWIFVFVLWIYGFAGALQGNKTLVPFLGEHFQKWFKTITEY
ncbi:MAG TPA: hypothetical protein VFM65_00830 [Flavobacteriaceae bacterium]|nr:hypothetical protein [Flavobacteriaceae bacterium]